MMVNTYHAITLLTNTETKLANALTTYAHAITVPQLSPEPVQATVTTNAQDVTPVSKWITTTTVRLQVPVDVLKENTSTQTLNLAQLMFASAPTEVSMPQAAQDTAENHAQVAMMDGNSNKTDTVSKSTAQSTPTDKAKTASKTNAHALTEHQWKVELAKLKPKTNVLTAIQVSSETTIWPAKPKLKSLSIGMIISLFKSMPSI